MFFPSLLGRDGGGMVDEALNVVRRRIAIGHIGDADKILVKLLLRFGQLASHLVDQVGDYPEIVLPHPDHRIEDADVRTFEERPLFKETQIVAVRIEYDERILEIDQFADDPPCRHCLSAACHREDRQVARDDLPRRQRDLDVAARDQRADLQLRRTVVVAGQQAPDILGRRIENFARGLDRVGKRRKLRGAGVGLAGCPQDQHFGFEMVAAAGQHGIEEADIFVRQFLRRLGRKERIEAVDGNDPTPYGDGSLGSARPSGTSTRVATISPSFA